ncbi:hypothetical protein [Paraburkholderia diazotrophica]|uniref:hypothetical protein n=1 Tax=Paraburkholderia diazotrophica TaxID=667676 RepID=UPI00317CC6F0
MKRHLVIAGTGRAGTSFLVEYLTACGLETHITRNPGVKLEENSNAGLEDIPDGQKDLPYVIKSPWLFEFIDRLIARRDIGIDAVILPVRDIIQAAASRVTNEMRARLSHEVEEYTRWENWGITAGGIVYSLNPLDQARLVAMGFHHVVHRLVENDIPIVFLDFPRFATDGEYLYRQLASVLPVDKAAALDAHRRTAKPDLVRVGKEISGAPLAQAHSPGIEFPSHDSLDRNALYRELQSCRSSARRADESHRMEADNLRREVDDLKRQTALLESIKQQAASLESSLLARDREIEQLRSSNVALGDELARLRESLAEAERIKSALQMSEQNYRERLTAVYESHTWRATAPIRAFLTMLKRSG